MSVGDRVEVLWNGKALAATVIEVHFEVHVIRSVDVAYDVDGSIGRYLTREHHGLKSLSSLAATTAINVASAVAANATDADAEDRGGGSDSGLSAGYAALVTVLVVTVLALAAVYAARLQRAKADAALALPSRAGVVHNQAFDDNTTTTTTTSNQQLDCKKELKVVALSAAGRRGGSGDGKSRSVAALLTEDAAGYVVPVPKVSNQSYEQVPDDRNLRTSGSYEQVSGGDGRRNSASVVERTSKSVPSRPRSKTAVRCARPSPSGGKCKNVPVAGELLCEHHRCPQCDNSKSGSAAGCPTHPDGLPSRATKRQQSVYNGFDVDEEEDV